jgi:hypothetical protein
MKNGCLTGKYKTLFKKIPGQIEIIEVAINDLQTKLQ